MTAYRRLALHSKIEGRPRQATPHRENRKERLVTSDCWFRLLVPGNQVERLQATIPAWALMPLGPNAGDPDPATCGMQFVYELTVAHGCPC